MVTVVVQRADGRFLNQGGGWNRLFSMAARLSVWSAAHKVVAEGLEGAVLLNAETQEPLDTQEEWLELAEESISIEAAKALLGNKVALLKQRTS